MPDARLIPPIVTDADRQWAIDQKPAWWDAKAKLKAERNRCRRLKWETHVADQAERFERHPEFVGERRTAAEWSGLWRRVWWPKADPHVRFPEAAPYDHEGEPHPYFKRDHPLWEQALALVVSPRERAICERFGVVQFKPGDPRLERLREAS